MKAGDTKQEKLVICPASKPDDAWTGSSAVWKTVPVRPKGAAPSPCYHQRCKAGGFTV
ncbi:MAG: hypothetical protein HFG50_10315 [Lachnospiraceae bacterium]|nr:hypothetical protein [Lachnospiraceae bacterium]